MLFKEYLNDKQNVFELIDLTFDDVDSCLITLLSNHGNRIFRDDLNDFEFEKLVKSININCGEKWANIIKVNELDIMKSNFNENIEITELTEKVNSNNINVNEVTAFDDDSMIVNDGSKSDNKEDKKLTKTVKNIDKKVDLELVNKNLSISNNNSIMNIVIKDILSMFTLDIY